MPFAIAVQGRPNQSITSLQRRMQSSQTQFRLVGPPTTLDETYSRNATFQKDANRL